MEAGLKPYLVWLWGTIVPQWRPIWSLGESCLDASFCHTVAMVEAHRGSILQALVARYALIAQGQALRVLGKDCLCVGSIHNKFEVVCAQPWTFEA